MKKLLIKPLATLVLGVQEKTTKHTKSGFILPDSTQKPTAITEVLAVGEDVSRVKVGTRVLYKLYSENQVSYEGVDYVIVDEGDVLAEVES